MIVHGLVVHSAQPGDGGVQLTEVVMSLGSLGGSHCRVTSHDSTVAVTFVGGGSGSRSTFVIHEMQYPTVNAENQLWIMQCKT